MAEYALLLGANWIRGFGARAQALLDRVDWITLAYVGLGLLTLRLLITLFRGRRA